MTLIELLVTCVILVIVLTAITQMFIAAIHSQDDQTNRVNAQQDARLALDRIRRDIRSGCDTSSASSDRLNVTFLPSSGACSSGTTISWCVTGTGPYTLARYSAANCGGTATALVSTLSSNALFSVASGAASSTLSGSNTVTLPAASLNLVNASGFAAGTNSVIVGTSAAAVTCTGKSSNTLTGCSGGSGTFSPGTWVTVSGQELKTVSVSLVARSSKAPYQQFTLTDSIVLRNSRT